MEVDFTSPVAAEDSQEKLYNARPTLIIGLGGSGKEVILRLRRIFQARHKQPGLPIIEYLWIDTDIVNKFLDATGYDIITRQVDLTAGEQIDARMKPQEVDAYYQAVGANPHVFSWFPQELKMLGSSVLIAGAGQIRPFGRLAFFHRFSIIQRRLRDKLDQIRSAERRRATEGLGFQVDNRVEVVVVTSLAGGTGSGMFIDLGFLLGHLRSELHLDLSTTGIFFLPEIFSSRVSSPGPLQANSYAALMELSTFMAPRVGAHKRDEPEAFEFQWTRDRKYRVAGPPYDNAYLIDRRNQADSYSDSFSESFQMVAEFLSLDFERTSLSQKKRSNRSNMDQFLATDTVVKFHDQNPAPGDDDLIFAQYFPNRFSTFGLSQIMLDHDSLRNAAGFRLAELILDFWLKDVEPEKGFRETMVSRYLERDGLNRTGLMQQLLLDEDGSRTFMEAWSDVVRKDYENLVSRVLSQFTVSNARQRLELWEKIDGELKSVERQAREIRTRRLQETRDLLVKLPDSKGKHLRLIESNVKSFEASMEKRLEDRVLDMLCSPTEAGTQLAEAFLEEAVASIRELAEDAKGQDAGPPADFPRLASAPGKGGSIETLYENLTAARRIPRVMTLGFGALCRSAAESHYKAAIDKELRVYGGRVVDEVKAYLEEVKGRTLREISAEYDRVALSQASRILDRLTEFVGHRSEIRDNDGQTSVKVEGLHAKLFYYKQRLLDVKHQMRELFEAYRKRRQSVRNLHLSTEIRYVEEIERTLARRLANRRSLTENLRLLSQSFFVEHRLVEGKDPLEEEQDDLFREGMRAIYDRAARYEHDRMGWQQVRNALEEFTFAKLEGFYQEHTAAELYRKNLVTPEEMEQALGKLVRMAAPYVASGKTTQRIDSSEQVQTMAIVGISEIEDPLVDTVKSRVRGQGMNAFQHSSGEEHRGGSVVLFVEKVAFPSFYLGNLSELKQAYISNIRQGPNNLFHRHIDKNTFEFRDIDPPQDDSTVQRRVDALHLILEGQILGVLDYRSESGFSIQRRDASGLMQLNQLGGSIEEAVEVICESRDIENELTRRCEAVVDGWVQDGSPRSFERYLAVLQHYITEVFPQPERFVAGTRVGAFSLRNHAVTRLFRSYSLMLRERTGMTAERLGEKIDTVDVFSVTSEIPYQDFETVASLRRLLPQTDHGESSRSEKEPSQEPKSTIQQSPFQ